MLQCLCVFWGELRGGVSVGAGSWVGVCLSVLSFGRAVCQGTKEGRKVE